MCGIAGIIVHQQDTARQALPKMNAAQAHRGPNDACGEAQYLPFGPVHAGLRSSPAFHYRPVLPHGHQPMVNPATGDQLIFNGEIYNFRPLRAELEKLGAAFSGYSDTEVLLHAISTWGGDVIPRLQGMFAFAFYNARSRELLLARDSVGIKPLYIARAPG